MSTECNPNLKSDVSVSDVILQPEITMTEVGEEATDSKSIGTNLKRVNSVNNLAIPGERKYIHHIEITNSIIYRVRNSM